MELTLEDKCATGNSQQSNREALNNARVEVNGARNHLMDVCQVLGVVLPSQSCKPPQVGDGDMVESNSLRDALETVPSDIAKTCREIHDLVEVLFSQLN